ncbi:bacteriochlorophyll 4-vinyl reductase [Tateyamaria omphalii]|uniref:bacteriochlorophyll 4-vinyl reductase n=1 Tax=Tateyamaria omphalii TaxID=299262 RepID=UPI001C98E4DE|nr:bacteriochlorophyll 4-vinyl reductase [Tateyamaria omphalii]MBY5934577.1 bacteriochlorophyll 4-vinyl reductase [Tateyamaria omphalii]
MSEDAHRPPGVIGPNAILQLLPLLDRIGGPERRAQMLAAAGIFDVPDGSCMIPEGDAARLHQQLRKEEPDLAPCLSSVAGYETANYILTHRIPRPAQWVLYTLPPAPAARLLSRAIEKHAWTFVGSGRLHVPDAWTFEISDNPLIRGERSAGCLCHWHAAVFARLYQALVSPSCTCEECRCGAQSGGGPCRFEVRCEASKSL